MRVDARRGIGFRGYVAIAVGVFLLVLSVSAGLNDQVRERFLSSVVGFFADIDQTVRDWLDGLWKKKERFDDSVRRGSSLLRPELTILTA